MLPSCTAASRMPAVDSVVSSNWRNSGIGFSAEILVALGRLARRASTSRPDRGLMSFRARLRLCTLGGTVLFFGQVRCRRTSISLLER